MVYFDVLTVTASKGSFSEGSDFSLVLHHRDLSQFALCVVLQQPKISLNVLQFPKVNKKYPLGGRIQHCFLTNVNSQTGLEN